MTPTQQKAIEMAIEALNSCRIMSVASTPAKEVTPKKITKAIEALRAALAEQADDKADAGKVFYVSVVVIKAIDTGFNTQNKLYRVIALSREEAHGKALAMAGDDFPQHNLHTICSFSPALDAARSNP